MQQKSAQERLKEGVTKANSGSQCTRAVINAIKGKADLYNSECGIADPGKAKAYLTSVGSTVYDGALKPGVVRIYEPVRKHTVGHIQMYCDDLKWRSDFVQKEANPWGDRQNGDKYTDYIQK